MTAAAAAATLAERHAATTTTTFTQAPQPPVYVTQTSVAVMTSPTLNLMPAGGKMAMSSSLTSLTDADSPLPARRYHTLHYHTNGGGGYHGRTGQCGSSTLPRVIISTGRSVSASSSAMCGSSGGGMGVDSNLLLRSRNPALQSSSMTVTSAVASADKFLSCGHFWPAAAEAVVRTPRTCLERAVFVLLTVALIVIFMVAALVLVYISSGTMDAYSVVFSNDRSASAAVHDGGAGNGLGSSAASFSDHEDEDDGVDIVRIKTTEQKVRTPFR
jgi:hypothetical protein